MLAEAQSTEARPARSGGRGARRALRSAPDVSMLPSLKRGIPLCEEMTGSQVERIDAASMDILEEVGVVFRDPIALEDWRRAGADVRGERVHLDRGLVRELISTTPSGFTYRARNPERSLPFGGPHSIFVPMTGAPFIRDLDDVRRWPTIADLGTFHKLAPPLRGRGRARHLGAAAREALRPPSGHLAQALRDGAAPASRP